MSPGEGTGATMSDDEQMDDPSSSSAAGLMMDSDASMMFEGSGGGAFDCSLGHDTGAFGPLIPTETERTLMERVRQELKSELKNVMPSFFPFLYLLSQLFNEESKWREREREPLFSNVMLTEGSLIA